MSNYVFSFLIIYAISIVVALIWLSIHYYWKNEEKKGRELSPLAKQWMMVSKPVGYFFLVLPIILIPITWVFDKLGGLMGIIVILGAPGALISMLKKGK